MWTTRTNLALTNGLLCLKDVSVKRIAIANPDHAPYGRAARAALQHVELWESIQPRLVLGESRETLLRDFQLARPTALNAVPFVYQRVMDGVCSKAPWRSCRPGTRLEDCDALQPGTGECRTVERPCFGDRITAQGRCDPKAGHGQQVYRSTISAR